MNDQRHWMCEPKAHAVSEFTPEFTQSLKGQESEKIHSASVESYLIKLGRYPWYVNGHLNFEYMTESLSY